MADNENSPSIVPVRIEDEMRSSYMDYAMSVIVGRALPDVRDGLKPVHRRILYAMYEQGNSYNRAYKKSARIVGDVIGKYHPHGDSAVYDALVRMAQDFSMRMPLVDGQGNFGSVDGDPAAAMRYTEVRMTRACGDILADIEKETVDFGPNYDGSESEPLVMPTRIPNLLINGSEGIAVGMATRIPPHNLGEIVAATIALIDNPAITLDELMQIVPAPDFPTRGYLYGLDGIREAYESGRGRLRIRARTEIEHNEKNGKDTIVVTELPYQVNKARLLEKIAYLVRDKAIDGITDLRDESDRTGMRMVIELRRDAMSQIVLNHLFKKTSMEVTFGINMLAIVSGQPRVLGLKDVLSYFVDFRRDVVTRRCMFELRKAQERLHILVALKKALDMIDEVVRTIRASKDAAEARVGLMDLLEIDEVQSSAILDMRLHRLTNLEINKLVEEIDEIESRIARLQEILNNESELLGVIRGELQEIYDAYAEPRRTEIIHASGNLTIEDLIADEDEVVTISHTGYIKRTQIDEYRTQRRGGKGLKGMATKEEDVVEDVWVTNTHAALLVFTSAGKVYRLKVHELPSGSRSARGKPIVNLIPVAGDEKVQAIVPFEGFDDDERFILTATRMGTVKKTALSLFKNIHAGGIIGVNLVDGDELINARLCGPGDHVALVTSMGQSIRFDQANVRSMGRNTTGVRGIKMRDGDFVVSMAIMTAEEIARAEAVDGAPPVDEGDEEVVEVESVEEAVDGAEGDGEGAAEGETATKLRHVAHAETVLTITENGYGKRTRFSEYRVQNRGGLGIITIKTTDRNGNVVASRLVNDEDELLMITNTGKIIRTRASDISILGRNTQGVRLMRLDDGETIVGVARFAEREDAEDSADDGEEGSDDVSVDAGEEGAVDEGGAEEGDA